MSSRHNSVQLTEEQEQYLLLLEEEFKDRYTENDPEFKTLLNKELPLPPIVKNWGNFRRRDNRWDSYRDGQYCNQYYHNYDNRKSQSSRQGYKHYRERNCYRNQKRPY